MLVSEIDVRAGVGSGWTPAGDGGHPSSDAQSGLASDRSVDQHDKLTGLPHRTLFVRQAQAALSREPDAVAVLLVGVDRFKEINDTLGHRTGDLVLREVASRLSVALSRDAHLARLGGDEFAVLCAGANEDSSALFVANELRCALDLPMTVAGIALNVEASIGIARASGDGADAHELLRRADVALAHAKAQRGGVEVYSQRYDTFDLARLRLLGDLRGALEQGGLILHYQPKIDLATKRIIGVEALLRWEHPERGMLPPLDFIPLIERTALIDPVTRFVIDEALRQVRSWRELGLDLEVAVNLAARNLLDPDLPQAVEGLLRQHAVPPGRLVLEVTESGVMVDAERASEVLAAIRSCGIGVSIDDFGTGHASLAYLARLPATELKIDRSFVSVACEDPRADAIVRASSDLARHFGMTVVAEGIETDAAMEHLIRVGCAVGQGYRISRPLPAQEMTSRLERSIDRTGCASEKEQPLDQASPAEVS